MSSGLSFECALRTGGIVLVICRLNKYVIVFVQGTSKLFPLKTCKHDRVVHKKYAIAASGVFPKTSLAVDNVLGRGFKCEKPSCFSNWRIMTHWWRWQLENWPFCGLSISQPSHRIFVGLDGELCTSKRSTPGNPWLKDTQESNYMVQTQRPCWSQISNVLHWPCSDCRLWNNLPVKQGMIILLLSLQDCSLSVSPRGGSRFIRICLNQNCPLSKVFSNPHLNWYVILHRFSLFVCSD